MKKSNSALIVVAFSVLGSVGISGCLKRNFNDKAASTASTVSGPKSYTCNPKAPIIPMGAPRPTGLADFKQFKLTLDSSSSPFKARVEKLGSFKDWLSVTAGKTDISKLSPSVTTGNIKSVVLSTFQVGYRYVITIDTGTYGDATFAIFAGRSIKNDKFTVGSVMVEEKDWGIAPGFSSLGGTLGECDSSSVHDEGVQGILNSIAVDKTGILGGTSTGSTADSTSDTGSAPTTCTVSGWISKSETDCAGKSGSCGAEVTIQGSGGSTNVRSDESTTSALVKTIVNGTQASVKGQNATGARLNVEAKLSGPACL